MNSNYNGPKGSRSEAYKAFLKPLSLAFISLLLLWAWLIAMFIGQINRSVHALFFLAIGVGFVALEQRTRVVFAARVIIARIIRER